MTQDLPLLAILFAAAAVFSVGLNRLAITVLQSLQVLDAPNARSSHRQAVPRGGGWAIAVTLVTLGAGISWASDVHHLPPWPIIAAAGVLFTISAIDDVRGLGPAPRFGLQIIAVALALTGLPGEARLLPDPVPHWMEQIALGLGWLWFINLFNFMDGIDGLAAAEAIAVAIGAVLVAVLALGAVDTRQPVALAAALAGSAIGFLVWNRPPARLFLGDVGSVLLGFLLAYLAIRLALAGAWASALLLPAYHILDATSTLLARLFRGETIWRPHRDHAYQNAVDAGMSHGAVCRHVSGLNVILIVLALIAAWPGAPVWLPPAALVAGYGLCLALIIRLRRTS